MFGIQHFAAFIVASVMLNLTPGADTIYILTRSAAGGRKQGITSALGITSGILVHTVLAAVGLSALLAASAAAFNVVKLLGAAYLILMGIRQLLKKGTLLPAGEMAEETLWKTYRQGVLTNVLNPKVALFFLALLPQYVQPGHSYGPLPFLLLGLTFVCTSTVWCVLVAWAAGFIANFLNKSERVSRAANKVTGCIYIMLGLNVLRARLAD